MQISAIKQNNPTSRGLHLNKLARKNITEGVLLSNKSIKECADKYEVLIKAKRKFILPKDLSPLAPAIITGVGVGGLTTMVLAELSSLTALAGTAIGLGAAAILPAFMLPLLGKFETKYEVQAGKYIKDKSLYSKLLGPKSAKHTVNDESDVLSIQNLKEEIENQEKVRTNKFYNIISKHQKNFDNTSDILEILTDRKIKKNFADGMCFNIPLDSDGSTLLTKFIAINPDVNNEKEYSKIINIMKNMPNIDYNQTDASGMPLPAKILKNENLPLLDLIQNAKIKYSKDLEDAYNSIKNEDVKSRAKELNITFTHPIEAMKEESLDKFKDSLKEIDSPLCSKEKFVESILDYIENNNLNIAYKGKVLDLLLDKKLINGEQYYETTIQSGRNLRKNMGIFW